VNRRFLQVSAYMVSLVLTAAACSAEPGVPEHVVDPDAGRWPALNSDLAYLWSAEPGIDLLSSPAVVVRAYFESVTIAGEAGDEELLYPGFASAVANEAETEPGSLQLWPGLRGAYGKERVGTMRDHILRVNDKGSNVEAVVCHWTWGMATLQENGTYWSGDEDPGPDAGVNTMRFTLLPPTETNQQLPPQRGPSKYPFDDVFSGWRVIGKLNSIQPIPNQEEFWPEFQQDSEACVAKAPESAERRMFLKGGEHPRSDFPTLPPYPGWPAESN
jgi:hypothetical protein